MCFARHVREEETIALRSWNTDQSTSDFRGPTADRHVGVDGLTVQHDELLLKQCVEVSALAGVTECRASDQTIDSRPPVLLESDDVLDVVHLTFNESFDARVAEVDEQPSPATMLVDDEVRAVVLASSSDRVREQVARADRPLLVDPGL